MFKKTKKYYMEVKETDRETLTKTYWKRSISALTDADVAIASERWNNAAGRIYYAVYYAVCSLFVNDGFQIKSHRGAKNVLNKEYVLTGKINKELSRFFSQMETLRDEADYDMFFEATKEDIMDYRPKAEAFIAAVKKLLDEEFMEK